MTGGLLDFFTLEATEYVDTLDALASREWQLSSDWHRFTFTP